jgi:hypothetical protein
MPTWSTPVMSSAGNMRLWWRVRHPDLQPV